MPAWFNLADIPQGIIFEEIHTWRSGFPFLSRSRTILLNNNGQVVADRTIVLYLEAIGNIALMTVPALVLYCLAALAVKCTQRSLQSRRKRNSACPRCGYSTLGLTSSLCPECGTPVVRTD